MLKTAWRMPVLTRKARLTGDDGRFYIIGTNSDLTDSKKRENQYKALSETVPVGVAQIDEEMEVTFANPLFNAYCGGDGTESRPERMMDKLAACKCCFSWPGLQI